MPPNSACNRGSGYGQLESAASEYAVCRLGRAMLRHVCSKPVTSRYQVVEVFGQGSFQDLGTEADF